MPLINDDDRARTFVLFPEWSRGDLVPRSLSVSADVRDRLRAWNRVWESVLDPVFEIRWPDIRVGRAWMQEGNALVAELQAQLGPDIQVVGDFAAYDPDA